jgi:nucleoid-associated protein YgaU
LQSGTWSAIRLHHEARVSIGFRLFSVGMMAGMDIVRTPQGRSPRSGVLGHRGRPFLLSLLCFFLLFAGVAASSAQDLGAVARRERARKENQPTRATHVYTKEDLARPQILTPEDRQRFEAARSNGNLPLDRKPAPTLAVEAGPEQVPLGDLSRKYRQQKLAREAKQTARFPLPVNIAPLATPTFSERRPSKPLVSRMDLRSSKAPQPVREMRELSKSSVPASIQPEVPPVLPAKPASRPTAHRTTPRPAEIMQPARRTIRPLASEPGVVEVRRGDSLWRLAERYLGQGVRWHDLYRANPWILDPDHIEVGSRISVGVNQLSSKPPLGIRIQRGDTLWKIAQLEFGRGTAWTCIAGANPQLRDANLILAGQELNLPQVCTPTP